MFEKDLNSIHECWLTLWNLEKKYPTVSVLRDISSEILEIDNAYGMMHSCLVYGDDFTERMNDYTKYISKEQLLEMYNEYRKYFEENVEVIKNVATDSDGVTYYSSKEK